MTISSGDRLHLANLLGMLGSDQIGERDNAAKLVETFRRRHGLIWTDLLASRLMGDPLKELLGQQVRPDQPMPSAECFHQLGRVVALADLVAAEHS